MRLRPAARRPGPATGASGSDRPGGAGTTEPCHHEDGGTRQAGDEHHDAVDDGGGDPLCRTQAGRAEHPCRHALARPPAADAGQHHGQQHEQRQRQHPGQRRGGARGPRGDQERGRVAADDQRRRERDAQPGPAGEQPVADVAGRCAPDPRPPGSTAAGSRPSHEHGAEHRHDDRDRDQRHGRVHGRRQREEDDDGQDDLHDLPGGALPRDGPQPAADIAHVATVADPAVDVADDPAGQRDVEEQRPVVRRHRSGQRQVDAETTGDDLPPPGTAHGGQHGEACRCRQRPAVDRADAVEERACAQAPDQNGERHGGAREAGPRPRRSGSSWRPICSDASTGRISRSAWSTVTASRPAAASARRRRA